MGRKSKIGKQRKDRFYKLAKETGYRSRAAFKLIQLNRKFEFLQRSKVCIDLCSAPGGWLQVAQKFMPVSSVIIGIDLFPIKPLHNVMTFQCDITTSKCRSLLKNELKTWKADVILNDGAPNVGKSWVHDAYAQIRLTLSAVQLASEFLMKGGWFITKIFRSKDYNALIWLLSKLFKKVHATKPQASRHESAEIFVVCEKFLAPDHIDPKFFDPSYLFVDITLPESERRKKAELLKPDAKKKKAKAEGYEDGDLTLFRKIDASEFIKDVNHIELLTKANEIVLDTDEIKNDPLTTDDIIINCKDIKVLGRKEILELIAWRRKLRKKLYPNEENKTIVETQELDLEAAANGEEGENKGEDEDDDELGILKRKKKKILKERRKLNERMSLKMIGDNELREEDDMELFTLKSLKNRKEVDRFQDIDMEDVRKYFRDNTDGDDNDFSGKKVFFDKDMKDDNDFEDDDVDPNHIEEDVWQDDDDIREEGGEKNPIELNDLSDDDQNGLVVDLDERSNKEKNSLFFQRQSFADEEFDDEIDKNLIKKEESKSDRLKKKVSFVESDSDESEDENDIKKRDPILMKKCKRDVKLSSEQLALGSILIESKKRKREIEDIAWNRYTHSDQEFLPSWFRKDEEAHFFKPTPIPESAISEYKQKLKEINDRPIKKVVEAKARQRKRAHRKLEKAKKKAEALTEAPDMTEKEKMATIRSLYKKATKEKKKDIAYVVTKKGKVSAKPGSVKGRYKLVDARMKKDHKKLKSKSNDKRGKKKRSKESDQSESKQKRSKFSSKSSFKSSSKSKSKRSQNAQFRHKKSSKRRKTF